jgi:hypothetical protein
LVEEKKYSVIFSATTDSVTRNAPSMRIRASEH